VNAKQIIENSEVNSPREIAAFNLFGYPPNGNKNHKGNPKIK
jgi:hypothetical protein